MNLARFGLTRNESGRVVEEGSYDLVDISEIEANQSSLGVEVIDTKGMQQDLIELAQSLGLFDPPQESFDLGYSSLTLSTRKRGTRKKKPKPQKYVRRKKNTTKKFVDRMKKKYDLLDLDRPIRDMRAYHKGSCDIVPQLPVFQKTRNYSSGKPFIAF